MNGSVAPAGGSQFTCMKAGSREWIALYCWRNDLQIAVEGDAEKR